MLLYQNYWLKNSEKSPFAFSFKNNNYVRDWILYERRILKKQYLRTETLNGEMTENEKQEKGIEIYFKNMEKSNPIYQTFQVLINRYEYDKPTYPSYL
jgi:hypothetical protein